MLSHSLTLYLSVYPSSSLFSLFPLFAASNLTPSLYTSTKYQVTFIAFYFSLVIPFSLILSLLCLPSLPPSLPSFPIHTKFVIPGNAYYFSLTLTLVTLPPLFTPSFPFSPLPSPREWVRAAKHPIHPIWLAMRINPLTHKTPIPAHWNSDH